MGAAFKVNEQNAKYLIQPEPTLIRGFELLATSPNANAKLRELILGLALKGLLVPRQRAAVQKYSESSVSRNRAAPLLKEFPLPVGWLWQRIGDLCDLRTGATPSTSKKEYFGGDIRWLVSGDINQQEIFECQGRVTEAGMANSNCKLLPIDSVLIALNGQGKTRASVALLRVQAACNQSLVAMTPRHVDQVLPEFIFWNLRYRYREIRDITGQDQRRGLNMGLVRELSIAVAPLEEQKRIIARVEELMKLCDALEARGRLADEQLARLTSTLFDALAASESAHELAENWQRIAEHFDLLLDRPEAIEALEKTILQLAVRGSLVARELGEPEWTKTKMGSVLEFQNGYAFKSEWFRSIGVPVVRNINIAHGSVVWGEKACVDQSRADEFIRFALAAGDLLISLDRPIISTGLKYAVVEQKDLPCLLLQRVARMTPRDGTISAEYLRLWLTSPDFISNIDPGRSNGVPHISTRQLEAIPMKLPPVLEQRRIVACVNELRHLCAQLRERLTLARHTQSHFAEALVNVVVSEPKAAIVAPAPIPQHSVRAAINCYVINKMADEKTFGRTKFAKFDYLLAAHLGVFYKTQHTRMPAGPHDEWVSSFEAEGVCNGWFVVDKSRTAAGTTMVRYTAKPGITQMVVAGAEALGEKRAELDRILALLKALKTEDVEGIATLYAVWNDALLAGKQPNDEEIITDFFNWHEKKLRFAENDLKTKLAWMRKKNLVPHGIGTSTSGQHKLFSD